MSESASSAILNTGAWIWSRRVVLAVEVSCGPVEGILGVRYVVLVDVDALMPARVDSWPEAQESCCLLV